MTAARHQGGDKRTSRRTEPLSALDLEIAQAFGDAKTIAQYLRQKRGLVDGSFITWLAEMLDPNSDEDFQLVFGRRYAGNPQSEIEALLNWASIREQVDAKERELMAQDTPPRGRRKRVIGEVARELGISDSAVRMALAKTRKQT
jgi:hypothetical protein